MIDFKDIWLPEILSYCRFLLMDIEVRRAWIEHDYSKTSITDYDELYEQIYTGMDATTFLKDLAKFLPNLSDQQVIYDFFAAIQKIENELQPILRKKKYELLFISSQWQALRVAAKKVVDQFKNSGFFSQL